MNINTKLKIGIFDSGLGSLTVLKETLKKFPNADYYVVADTAGAPYGGKTTAELLDINQKIIHFLKSKHINLLLIACNTSCSIIDFNVEIDPDFQSFGLISPAVSDAVSKTKNNHIIILATEKTISSKVYSTKINDQNPHITVTEIACPELVPIVENNTYNTPKSQNAINKYAQIITSSGADTLILGCSHYPFLLPHWKPLIPKNITICDPAKSLSNAIPTIPQKNEKSSTTLYISGQKAPILSMAKQLNLYKATNLFVSDLVFS